LVNVLRINVLGGLYLTAGQRPLAGAATQPRRLAVLALLAVAGERGVSRERILACLWPDTEEERARHALAQSLYALRHDLGDEELFLGQRDLRLNPDLITSDYAEFHDAIRGGDPERAIECFGGPFLQGFHLARADDFERWVEEQRDLLGHEFRRALEAAARRAVEREDLPAAVGFLKRWSAQDPLNGRVTVKLMEILAAQGAVVAALQHARVHEELVRQELDLAPDPEVLTLAARLRNAPRALPASSSSRLEASPRRAENPARPAAPDQVPGPLVAGESRPLRWGAMAAIALVTLVLGLVLGLPHRPARIAERGPTVVAVGLIADYTGRQPGWLGRSLADMLATNLARGSGFRVISTSRMLELMRQLQGTGDSGVVVSAAARQAGAAELLDGALYATAPNRYRLDLRRVDLANGTVIRAYRVEAPDVFALADSVTAALVRDLGGPGPAGPLADVTTNSMRAYQFYEEGLQRFYNGDVESAERLFHQALLEDSGFAQAAYYYARSTSSASRTETVDRFRRAMELANRAGDRERLLMQAEWAFQNSSPALPAIAETLMIRYPEEVDGYFFAGQGAMLKAEYLKAVAPYRKVIALDSLGLEASVGPRCRACEAYAALVGVYFALDSVSRSRATILEWVRREPSSAAAWRAAAHVYAGEHQESAAMAALRVADSLEPTNPQNHRNLISIRWYVGDWPEAEQLLRQAMETGPLSERRQAQWDLAVVLRQRGRLHEALKLAHDYRMSIKERLLPGAAPYNALLEGQILFELRDYGAAAKLFDSIAVGSPGGLDSTGRIRDQIWAWVHEADALAQLGDTARLEWLADSMEVLGHAVGQARERILHGHVRGLVARIAGRDDEAVGWFRRSMVSPVVGLTRTNYELAGIYLRTGRPVDAIRILGPAIRAGIVGPSLYITRTELEARLAEAFDQAGQPDSAMYYYARAIHAWEGADRQFWPRRDSLVQATRRLDVATRLPGAGLP
jgi:DNA-binding SARP family transcriptional activator/TolB-like protein